MTIKNFFKKLKNSVLSTVLAVGLVLSFTIGLVACNNSNVVVTDPTYSYITEDSSKETQIKNQTFADNLSDDTVSFPANATSWSIAVDDSAVSSSVKSGVVNTTATGWEKTITTLCDDPEFISYIKYKYSLDTEESAKEKIREIYTAPSRTGSEDSYVYMINNYREKAYTGIGTAQKITSTATVSLDNNSTYKLTVYVKTVNLAGTNPDGFGASVQLINKFNSATVGDFLITNITDTDWTKYTAYVKTDDTYSCSVTVALGLGFGNGSNNLVKDYVEGTAYFDDITFEKVEDYTADTNGVNVVESNMIYGSTKDVVANATSTSTNNAYLYTMSVKESVANFYGSNAIAPNTLDVSNLQTKTNVAGFTYPAGSSITPYVSTDELKLDLVKTSATLKIGGTFSLDAKKSTIISFKLKNELINFGSTDVVVDVIDILGSTEVKRPAVASFSTISEDFVDCVILVNNNFESINRQFRIELVCGPSAVADVERANDFATGAITIKDIVYSTTDVDSEDDIKGLIVSNANAKVALYAGYGADATEDTTEEETYTFNTAPGNVGEIISYPTNPNGYDGVVSNHVYVLEQDLNYSVETDINTRSGYNADTSKGYAGLINTKYLNEYATNGVGVDKTLLNWNDGDDHIQPLMINNATLDSYGFVAKSSTTINSSSFASISVKVRVVGDAVAYLYLVDTSKLHKEVLTFEDFTVNTSVVKGVANGTQIKGSDLAFSIKVTKDMMDADGWATVNFYIATGKDSKNVRLELWNGDRTGTNKSTGYVFFDGLEIVSSSAFEPTDKWSYAFTTPNNPLFDQTFASYDNGELYAFRQNLTEDEINYNNDYPDSAKEYFANYVWAKNSLSVYADYSTLDNTKVISNPYDSVTEEETASGCAANTDPSTFWLSFSTIILIVALALAILALIVKNFLRRRKANASDAKSHYKVTSRIKKKAKPEVKDTDTTETTSEVVEETETETETVETAEDVTEEVSPSETEDNGETTTETDESTDNGYVYGEVIEDFTITENEDNGENKPE